MGSIRYRILSPVAIDIDASSRESHVYAFWHQRMLAFANSHRRSGVRILISSHGDGELIAGIVDRLGLKSIRGSTSRGGTQAMKELLDDLGSGHDYAFTPDGPRGPRHCFQAGAIYFASRSGLPLVPATVAYRHCWKLRSWDQFVIPWPFTRAVVHVKEILRVPPALDGDGVERWRKKAETLLRETTEETDRDFEALYARAVPWRPQRPESSNPRTETERRRK